METAPENAKDKRKAVDLEYVRDPIDQTLRSLGFHARSKRLWDRQSGRIAQVIHLDKSSYSPQNKLEIFLSVQNLPLKSKYKLSDFDVKINFDRIVEHSLDFKSALNQETVEMAPDIRAQIIQNGLSQSLEPILNLAVDEIGLQKLRELIPSKNDLFIGPRTTEILKSID